MVCCGEDRLTPYCPMCGKDISVNVDLFVLLDHLRKTGKRYSTMAMRWRKRSTKPGYLPNSCERRAALYDESANKWNGWANGLAALMSQSKDIK
jgi:hypothetical protein